MMPPPVDRFTEPAFWRELCPELSITDVPMRAPAGPPARDVTTEEAESQGARLGREGFFVYPDLFPPELITPLAEAALKLVDNGIPASFLFVYDEAWQLFGQAAAALEAVIGPGYRVGGDMWVWHVPADESAAGWSAHRDDANMPHGFLDDGTPSLVTTWIALSAAGPENSCMYVLPADHDPGYRDSNAPREVSRSQLASIRALPATPGTLMGWDTRLLHWGSKSTSDAQAPRMSLSLFCQRGDVPVMHHTFVDVARSIPFHHRTGAISNALEEYNRSGLAGTTMPEWLRPFVTEERRKFSTWMSMVAQLRGTEKAITG